MLTRIASTILGNEKALALYEMHEQSPDHSGFHRYQIIFVVRDGEAAEWRKDMGLAKNFKGVNQLRIPSYLELSVDECMDIADWLREEIEIDIKDFLQLDYYKPA